MPWYQPSQERLGFPGLRQPQSKHDWTFQPDFSQQHQASCSVCEASCFREIFIYPFQLPVEVGGSCGYTKSDPLRSPVPAKNYIH